MSYRFPPRSFGMFAAVAGLVMALAAPAWASAATDARFAQADSSDQSMPPAATTDLDPCQLVTSAEASALAGTTYAAGREETTDGGSRICVYGYQTQNVFMVLVTQAPDTDTAQTAWATEQARVQDLIQSNLPPAANVALNVNQDAGLQGYDRSATASASGAIATRTLNISAIYLLKGPTFVSFSDLLLDNAAPSVDALAGEAQTVQPRLP